MDKKDEKAESSPLGHDSKRFRDTAGASSQSTETDNDSYMADEKEAAQYVKQSVKSYIKVLNIHIPTAVALFIISAGSAIALHPKLKSHVDVRSVALLHAIILTLNLDSLEIPASPPVQVALPRRCYTTVAFFYASSIIFLFSATFAVLLKSCINRFLLHGGGSMIERRAEFERWRFDLLVDAPEVMFLVAVLVFFCGLVSLATA